MIFDTVSSSSKNFYQCYKDVYKCTNYEISEAGRNSSGELSIIAFSGMVE